MSTILSIKKVGRRVWVKMLIYSSHGFATNPSACLRILRVHRSWRNGRLQSAFVLGSGFRVTDGDGGGEDGGVEV